MLFLTTPSAAAADKVKLIGKIRESLENVYGPEYGAFLKEFVPVFMRILQNVPRQTVLNMEHKLRNMILEVRSPSDPHHSSMIQTRVMSIP